MEDFKRNLAIIESRTLYYDNKYDSQLGALVPYYDFFNHEFLHKVNIYEYFYYDKDKKTYVMKAYQNFEKNQ